MFKKTPLVVCALLLTASLLQVVQAQSLKLSLEVNEKNDLGENISVHGNLTLNGSPVTDGLVAIQIDDPHDNLFILRTLKTGEGPAGNLTIEITQFLTCDSSGNPKSNFGAGGDLGLKLTVKNNDVGTQHVIVAANLYYSNGVPFDAFILYEADMNPESEKTLHTWPIPIPHDALLGPAFAYASAINSWPKNGGFAYSPEKSAAFNIVSSGGSGGTYRSEEAYGAGTAGKFNLTFCTNPQGGVIGNYTVSAVSQYKWSYIANQTTFEVYLLGDVNGDGKVRVDDVLAVALAFGTNEGDPDWDPRCDLNGDHKVRVDDVLIVALAFGKSGG